MDILMSQNEARRHDRSYWLSLLFSSLRVSFCSCLIFGDELFAQAMPAHFVKIKIAQLPLIGEMVGGVATGRAN
jgi:hypothetical protein